MSVFVGKPSMFFDKAVVRLHINHSQVRLNHNIRHTRIASWIGKHQLQGFSGKDLLDPGFSLLVSKCLHHVGRASVVLQPEHCDASVLLCIEEQTSFDTVHNCRDQVQVGSPEPKWIYRNVAMFGGENDKGRVEQMFLLQPCHNFSHRLISVIESIQ